MSTHSPVQSRTQHPRLRLKACLLATVVLASLPARACCTDFWSCSIAVASAGASCAYEAALRAAHELTELVLRERDRARRAVEEAAQRDAGLAHETAQQWQQRAEGAAGDSSRAVARAAQLVGEDTDRRRAALNVPAQAAVAKPPTLARQDRLGGVVQTQPRAAGGAASPDTSLVELHRLLLTEDREIQGLRRASAEQSERAHQAIGRWQLEVVGANSAIVATAFAGVLARMALAQSDTDPARLLALAADAAAVAELVSKLVRQVEQEVARHDDEILRRLQQVADSPQDTALHAERRLLRSRELLAQMERLVRVQSLQERAQQTRVFLAAAPADGAPRHLDRVGLRLASGPATVGAVRQGLEQVQAQLLRLPGLARRPDVTPFRALVQKDLQSRFQGLSPADAAHLRDQLLMEARQRLARQTQVLPEVEALIQQAAAAAGHAPR